MHCLFAELIWFRRGKRAYHQNFCRFNYETWYGNSSLLRTTLGGGVNNFDAYVYRRTKVDSTRPGACWLQPEIFHLVFSLETFIIDEMYKVCRHTLSKVKSWGHLHKNNLYSIDTHKNNLYTSLSETASGLETRNMCRRLWTTVERRKRTCYCNDPSHIARFLRTRNTGFGRKCYRSWKEEESLSGRTGRLASS